MLADVSVSTEEGKGAYADGLGPSCSKAVTSLMYAGDFIAFIKE